MIPFKLFIFLAALPSFDCFKQFDRTSSDRTVFVGVTEHVDDVTGVTSPEALHQEGAILFSNDQSSLKDASAYSFENVPEFDGFGDGRAVYLGEHVIKDDATTTGISEQFGDHARGLQTFDSIRSLDSNEPELTRFNFESNPSSVQIYDKEWQTLTSGVDKALKNNLKPEMSLYSLKPTKIRQSLEGPHYFKPQAQKIRYSPTFHSSNTSSNFVTAASRTFEYKLRSRNSGSVPREVSNGWTPVGGRRMFHKFRGGREYPKVNDIIAKMEFENGMRPNVYHVGQDTSGKKVDQLLNFIDVIDSKPEATNRMGFGGDSYPRKKRFFSDLLPSIWPEKRESNRFKDYSSNGAINGIPRDVAVMEILNNLEASRRNYQAARDRHGYSHFRTNRHRAHSRRPYKGRDGGKHDSSKSEESNQSANNNTNADNVLSGVTVYTYSPRRQRDRGRVKGSYGSNNNNNRDSSGVAQTPGVVILDSNNRHNRDDLRRTEQLFQFLRDVLINKKRYKRHRKRLPKYLKYLLLLTPFVKIPLTLSLLALVPGLLLAAPGVLPALQVSLAGGLLGKKRKRRSLPFDIEVESIECLQMILCQSLRDLPNGELKIMERIIRYKKYII